MAFAINFKVGLCFLGDENITSQKKNGLFSPRWGLTEKSARVKREE